MAMVDVDGSSLLADLDPKSDDLIWWLADTRRSVCFHQMNCCSGLFMTTAATINIVIGVIVTFHVSRRRCEMYSGHTSVCLSVCPSPH